MPEPSLPCCRATAVPVYALNGWAAEDSIWDRCTFPRARLFNYLEEMEDVPGRALQSVPEFILVGFSMGGSMALRLALRFPDRLRGLVLVSATARMMEDPATNWKGMSLRRRAALKLGTQIAFRDNPSPLFEEGNLDRGLDFLQTADLRAALRAIPADSNLRRIPVAVFQSERDGIVRPSNADFLKSVFPQARVTLIPGTEHTLPPLIPERIDAAVRACLGDKSAIRREMRARRKAVSPDDRARASREICGKILARDDVRHALDASGGTLAVYLASPDEFDLTPVIEAVLARGVTVAAPRWNGTSYDLARLKSLEPADLRIGPMGIREPAAADLVPPRAVSVWLVPGLAFTRAGARLGYGGGWYDRFLADASPSALKLGVAHSFQLVDFLPSEPHDIPLGAIIVCH